MHGRVHSSSFPTFADRVFSSSSQRRRERYTQKAEKFSWLMIPLHKEAQHYFLDQIDSFRFPILNEPALLILRLFFLTSFTPPAAGEHAAGSGLETHLFRYDYVYLYDSRLYPFFLPTSRPPGLTKLQHRRIHKPLEGHGSFLLAGQRDRGSSRGLMRRASLGAPSGYDARAQIDGLAGGLAGENEF